jgi:nitric oxide reductase NorD protein
MDITELSELFYELVAPSMPSEVDVEESLQPLVGENEKTVNDILQQVPAIWPVSYSLCFAYLANVHKAIPYITQDNLDIWVKELLEKYEEKGLHSVLARIKTVRFSSPRLQGKKGLRLDDVRGRLQLYLNGLAGKEVPIIASGTTYTDTHSIFVPWEFGN